MARNYDNVHIYSDEESAVYVADKGTTAPTGLEAPAAGWTEVGWLSEDGISLDRSEDATTFRAFQGATVVKRKTTSVEDTFTFQCLEENAVVLGLVYKGEAPTVTGTGAAAVAEYNVTNQTRQDDRAFVIDLVDGEVTKRYVIPVASVTTGTVAHSSADLTVYEFTGTIVGDYLVRTNGAGVTGNPV